MSTAGTKQTTRRGRPPLPPGQGKRYPLNMRTTKETRDWLAAVSKANGRSLAQEVELLVEKARLGEQIAREHLEQEFGGPHNYALAKTVAFLAREIEETTNARWTEDRDTFEQLDRAIETVLKGVETPKAVVASASSRVARPPARKGHFSLGRAFALGFLDQVELAAAKGGQDSQQVSRLLRLASELAPALGPLLKRTPHMSGVRFVSGAVEVEPKAQNKR